MPKFWMPLLLVCSMDSTDPSLEVHCYPYIGCTVNIYSGLFLDLTTYMSSPTPKLLPIYHIVFHVPYVRK